MEINKIFTGNSLDVLRGFTDKSINCCVTSPPYFGLRDYGTEQWVGGDSNCDHTTKRNRGDDINGNDKQKTNAGSRPNKKWICECGAIRKDDQIGLEETPEQFVNNLVDILREVKRVLRDDGTLWLNLGDSYAGSGKGANPDGTPHLSTLMGKQGTNKGSVTGINKPQKAKEIGLKPKDLIGIPWMVAFALRADGWYLRQDIIWHKPNPMPESVTDRCSKSHEYIFLLSKSQKYYYDYEAIQEIATGYDGRKDTMMKGSDKYNASVIPGKKEHTMAARGHERWKFKNLQDKGQQNHSMHESRANGANGANDKLYPIRNKRSVWTVNTKPYSGAHFATFPEKLIVDCINAGCPEDGVVLDPFMGAGTTAIVAKKFNRNYVGIELNPEYVKIAETRLYNEIGMFL